MVIKIDNDPGLYTGSTGSSLLTDRCKFWMSSQVPHESIQEWEVKVSQASSLCAYGELTDELTRDKFVFGLNEDHTRTELLKTHVKPDNTKKTLQDVVPEERAIESAKQTNKLMNEEVHWTGLRHSQMKLRREPGTSFWCGDRRGDHPWRVCSAKGKTCSSCGGSDHFARVCLEDPTVHPTVPGRPRMDNGVTHDRVASGTTHVQIHLPSHETFTTVTCMSQRSSSMTHPMIMIAASHTPWKHKYTASRLPAR